MSEYELVKTFEELALLPVGTVVVTDEAVARQLLDVDMWVAFGDAPLTSSALFEAAESLRLVFEPESGEEF